MNKLKKPPDAGETRAASKWQVMFQVVFQQNLC